MRLPGIPYSEVSNFQAEHGLKVLLEIPNQWTSEMDMLTEQNHPTPPPPLS